MASKESLRVTRRREQEQPLPVDFDFAELAVDESFLKEDQAADDAGKREEAPLAALEPVEPKLPETDVAEGERGEHGKSAILARISQSVREIEERKVRHEIVPADGGLVQGETSPDGSKEPGAKEAILLPPPGGETFPGTGARMAGEAAGDAAKEPAERARIPMPRDVQVTANANAGADLAAEPESESGGSSGERIGGLPEGVKAGWESEAGSEDSGQSGAGEAARVTAFPGADAGEAAWGGATRSRLREAFFGTPLSYGKVFLLCFLIPLVILTLVLMAFKDVVRGFFAADVVENPGPTPAMMAEAEEQKEVLAELRLRLAGLENKIAETNQRLAEEAPDVNEEIKYLQMRNELTAYGDEAITMANRAQYEKLWDVVYDESLGEFHAAAVSEILRVKFFYASGSRLGAWTLPVRELFPGSETEADLEVQQVIDLLTDRTQDWRVRMRAARLLEGQRTRRVLEALHEAIHEDPNLDVLKEAIRTFEVNAGFVGEDFFDVESVDAWWEANSENLEEKAGS